MFRATFADQEGVRLVMALLASLALLRDYCHHVLYVGPVFPVSAIEMAKPCQCIAFKGQVLVPKPFIM